MTIDDGNFHPVDSSDIAFQLGAIGGFWQAFEKAKPEILEPIMKVSVEGPTEFQGIYTWKYKSASRYDCRHHRGE
jgi:elongation factor G